MRILKELKKIARQAQAKENMFGYKSTEANQLFLFYCFNGKIFFTDKIHPQVKYLWFSILAFETSISYFGVLSNLWYGVEKNFMVLFDLMNLIGACNMLMFGYPFILYWFRTNIESMIEEVDEICSLQSSSRRMKYKNILNVKKVLLLNFSFISAGLAMSFIYLFDVMLFFEQEKIDNRYYNMVSVPLVEKFRSNDNYFIFNFLMNVVLTILCTQNLLMTCFVLYWCTTCYNALICAANEMNIALDNMDSHFQLVGTDYETWNQHFTIVLIHNIKLFQKIIRIIDNFRGYVQVIGTAVIPASFFIAVAQLHVAMSANSSPILIHKSLSACFICVWIAFMLYWAAEKLENSVSELSRAIYSTPWYESVQPRKLVCVFLCQTQRMKNLNIVKVYLLSLRNFSRYLHGILTYTNAIRALTNKH